MRRGLAEVFSSAEEGAASTAKEIGDRTHSSAAVRIIVVFINVEGGGNFRSGSFS
jgi:hypothetical protein